MNDKTREDRAEAEVPGYVPPAPRTAAEMIDRARLRRDEVRILSNYIDNTDFRLRDLAPEPERVLEGGEWITPEDKDKAQREMLDRVRAGYVTARLRAEKDADFWAQLALAQAQVEANQGAAERASTSLFDILIGRPRVAKVFQ